MRLRLLVAVTGALAAVPRLQAQPASLGAQVDIRLSAGPPPVVAVAIREVLNDGAFDELLRSGFPTRIHVRSDVWTVGRWINDLRDQAEWDIIVQYDVIDHSYDVLRSTRSGLVSLGTYARFPDARAATELAYQPALRLPTGSRGYIAVRADVQTLDISDLAEVQRWLRGEARPAIKGQRNPGTALTRGLRTLVSRLLGGEVRHLEARTAVVTF